MDAIRYGFVLPLVVACTAGWIHKHSLWAEVLLGGLGLAILFVLACSVWGFMRDMDHVRRQQRRQLDDAGRDAANRLSPPQ